MRDDCLLCGSNLVEKREISAKSQGSILYGRCGECEYIFMDPAQRLSAEAERKRYELHENEESAGYRQFLKPVVDVVLELEACRFLEGLDFGCGPSRYLRDLFAEHSILVETYDPFFKDDPSLLQRSYDFVTCTEVFEHLYEPARAIEQLSRLVRSGGLLLVMTSMPPPFPEAFAKWSYRRDVTHVGFFSRTSFEFIARRWGFELILAEKNLFVLKRL